RRRILPQLPGPAGDHPGRPSARDGDGHPERPGAGAHGLAPQDRERAPEGGLTVRIPLAYNIRNLAARKVSTLLTALGIGLVSWVFIFTLALAGGFQSALKDTGSRENAIVVRNGSTAELTSIIDRESAAAIESQPEIARATDGQPLATHELVVLWNLARKNGT